jgi:hypothetical protein
VKHVVNSCAVVNGISKILARRTCRMYRFISKFELAQLMGDEENCIQLLFDEGLLNTRMLCSECDVPMQLRPRLGSKYPHFECAMGHERIRISCSSGTWFENSKVSPVQILLLMHCFASNNSYKQTVIETSVEDTRLSKVTIDDWFSYCREVCTVSMNEKYRKRGKIGGPGHIIEVDECKISIKKQHPGRMEKRNWILGMIARNTGEVRMTVWPVNQRNGRTLYNLISDYVDTRSIIHTDCWGRYRGVMAGGFQAHLSRNHSQDIFEQVERAHTSQFESHWVSLRRSLLSKIDIPHSEMDIYICEHLWRKDCESRNADPFQQLIEDIRKMYPLT